jgi:hypothetical protein
MSGIDYARLKCLDGLAVEESFVLRIATTGGRVDFFLDAVLTPEHPDYRPPRSGEQFCFKKLRLRFPAAREVDWGEKSADVRIDSEGETDLGHIDAFVLHKGRYALSGDWGSVSIVSDPPVVVPD